MNVHLTPQLEEMVRAQVATGRYTSASELVREALRLFEERQRLSEMRLEDLRREIRVGVEAFERGEVRDFDDSLAEEIHQRGLARMKQRQGHE